MVENTKLKTIRLRMGLTQKQLGKRLRITQGAISHWEKGISYPSVIIAAKIVKLANKYGIECTTEALRTK